MIAVNEAGHPTSNARAVCAACGNANGGTLQHLVTCAETELKHIEFDTVVSRAGVAATRDPWKRAWYVFKNDQDLLCERIGYVSSLLHHIWSSQKTKKGELHLANSAVHSQRPTRSSPTRVSQIGATNTDTTLG